jgi:plasmid maintenance system antidote protein VapI
MALRLSKAFDTTAEFWLNLQRNHDLWQASQKISLSGIRHWVAAKRTTGIGKRA